LQFLTNDASSSLALERMTITQNGNVGIGVSNPTDKLTVEGNIRANAITSINGLVADMRADSSGAFFGLGDTGNYYSFMRIGAFSSQNFIQNNGGRNLIIQMNGTTRMRILQSGMTEMSEMSVGFTSIGGDTWHNAQGRQVNYYGSDGRNYYKGSNNIPHTWRPGGDNNIMSLTDGGNLRANGPYTNVSDERIKKDIEDIDDEDSLNKILLVQCKKYKYIDESKGTGFITGFIAQQIKEIIPEAVHIATEPQNEGDEIQDFHYLDKMMIYTHNVSVTQELHRMLKRQETIIDSLISRIEALES